MEVEGLQHSSLCSDESCLRTFPIYSQRAFPYIDYSGGQVLYWFCCLDKSWTACQNFLKGKDSSHIFFDIYKTCKIQKVLNYNLLQKSQWEDKQIEKKNTEKVEKCVCLCLYVRFPFCGLMVFFCIVLVFSYFLFLWIYFFFVINEFSKYFNPVLYLLTLYL